MKKINKFFLRTLTLSFAATLTMGITLTMNTVYAEGGSDLDTDCGSSSQSSSEFKSTETRAELMNKIANQLKSGKDLLQNGSHHFADHSQAVLKGSVDKGGKVLISSGQTMPNSSLIIYSSGPGQGGGNQANVVSNENGSSTLAIEETELGLREGPAGTISSGSRASGATVDGGTDSVDASVVGSSKGTTGATQSDEKKFAQSGHTVYSTASTSTGENELPNLVGPDKHQTRLDKRAKRIEARRDALKK